MTIITGSGRKFIEEIPLGIHKLSESGADTIKLAIYGPNANISPNFDTYTTVGEISGGGYTAGGVVVPLTLVGSLGSSRNAGTQFAFPYIQPTNDTEVSALNIGIRGCMLYNSSQNDRNIFTLDFGSILTGSSSIRLKWGLSRVNDQSKVLIPLFSVEQ